MTFGGPYDVDPLDRFVLFLSDIHRSHSVDTTQVCISHIIKCCFRLLCYARVGIIYFDIFVAFVSTHMSTTDVKVHARVAYGSSYSLVCDMIRLLWSIPHRRRYTRLRPHHESG